MNIAMSRFKRVSKDDLRFSTATAGRTLTSDAGPEGAVGAVSGVSGAARFGATDPANVAQDKSRANWWLPVNVESWLDVPQQPMGEPTKEKPLTVEQLMRREREFHLFGRGSGGKHLPDHSARLIAFILDYAMHGAVFLLAMRALDWAYPDGLSPLQVKAVAAAAAWIALSFLPLVLWRATLGKLMLGLRLIRADGEEASVARTILRGTVVLLAPLAIPDVLVVLMSPHRRRLIDYLAGTRVVANR